ncbi:hypothetical protein [Actinoplanes couchii]|uniref:Secreted protein n=1 Tax=Actinoplanes couchii TaxID=403638 RepID=A0ABQ3XSM8_9ACTN|nr:hypothetical protein [Actinoplanes couchii]MDR6318541.1 hypothetical protein [Actinoplanes couchii]GID61526.1 hypothetical protein Aco03nite_099300 [Actinoplanes couchii]
MRKRLLRLLAAAFLGAGLVTTTVVSPASARTDTGFGPFTNSSVDCGQSVYISDYSVKYWACTWHTLNGGTAGHVKTGIVIQNYGSVTRGVTANWTRYWELGGNNATSHSQLFGTGVSLPAGQYRTLWDWYTYTGNGGTIPYYGTKGLVKIVSGSTVLKTGGNAYSPLQSWNVGCKDSTTGVWNWVDTGRNCDG